MVIALYLLLYQPCTNQKKKGRGWYGWYGFFHVRSYISVVDGLMDGTDLRWYAQRTPLVRLKVTLGRNYIGGLYAWKRARALPARFAVQPSLAIVRPMRVSTARSRRSTGIPRPAATSFPVR